MSAREQMAAVLREAAMSQQFGTTVYQLVEDQLNALVAAVPEYGWLIRDGAIRTVEIADRFGPSSWEITTEEHPHDRESWGRHHGTE